MLLNLLPQRVLLETKCIKLPLQVCDAHCGLGLDVDCGAACALFNQMCLRLTDMYCVQLSLKELGRNVGVLAQRINRLLNKVVRLVEISEDDLCSAETHLFKLLVTLPIRVWIQFLNILLDHLFRAAQHLGALRLELAKCNKRALQHDIVGRPIQLPLASRRPHKWIDKPPARIAWKAEQLGSCRCDNIGEWVITDGWVYSPHTIFFGREFNRPYPTAVI